MAILTFYNPYTLEQDAGGQLGVLNLDHEFISVMGYGGAINPLFHRYLCRLGVDSLQVTCRSGLARFRKENRPDKDGQPRFYWYAYKKIGGKLNKVYIGTASQMTEDTIEKAVTKVNTIKPKVTQSDCVTSHPPAIATIPPVELAGHGKSDRHLQPSLIAAIPTPEFEKLTAKCKKQADQVKELESLLANEINYSTEIYNQYRDLRETIAKYRDLAQGKTKKDNPRFAYLIDLLADIDKLC